MRDAKGSQADEGPAVWPHWALGSPSVAGKMFKVWGLLVPS